MNYALTIESEVEIGKCHQCNLFHDGEFGPWCYGADKRLKMKHVYNKKAKWCPLEPKDDDPIWLIMNKSVSYKIEHIETYLKFEDVDAVYYCGHCGAMQDPEKTVKFLEYCHSCGTQFNGEVISY